jgi:hypothetical protein
MLEDRQPSGSSGEKITPLHTDQSEKVAKRQLEPISLGLQQYSLHRLGDIDSLEVSVGIIGLWQNTVRHGTG